MTQKPETQIAKEHITPAMAKEWLKNQHKNRKISTLLVDKYAATMSAGDWKETHQGIAFDSKGRLCDGAHRMMALASLEGKVPELTMIVTRGLTDAAVEVLDSGRARSLSDRMAIVHGTTYATTRVAVANVLLHGRGQHTDQRIIHIINQTKGAIDSLASIHGLMGRLRSGAIAALAYVFPTDPVAVMRFARSLVDGDELKKGSAIYVARKLLVEKPMLGSAEARQTEFRVTLSALKAHMSYMPVKYLRDSTVGVEHFNRKRAELGLEVYVRVD